MSRERKYACLALLATSIIWGIAPPVIKYTLRFISPFSFLFYRFLAATIMVFIPFMLRLKKIKPDLSDLPIYLFLGFLCAPLNLGLLFLGIQKTTAISASMISIVSPILIILGGAVFLKEQITKKEKTGIFLALSGTVLTIVQPLLETKPSANLNLEGNFLIFLGTLAWVVFTLLTKKHQKIDPFLLTCFSYLIGIIFIFPFFALEKTTINPLAIPGIIYMALFSSVFAYFFYVFGLSKMEVSEASVFTYLQPVFAIPISILLLKEKLTPFLIIGAVLIIFGLIVCETRSKNQALKQEAGL
ncbi:hypothetical protein CO010_02870 [Candidatus Shapirobacteria bacterium CG_4_8_14_3_um_filter_39_11]|uniref:EamA domain-containing protein n=1 Tax=Candidatus Shapirobacteria bacterium CG_4_8_14_3_um_filter_39_11 TaxID=1974875 RepID=A0A2M8GG96_9BACT|nr:MAG: hypothetical protein CO010_02870 [Candidatus Shapirobacteria bacterium CG_4_8_14_3_um_filter_39_11]